MKDWDLTAGEFDHFLNWLNTDRDQAGREYEGIRRRLIVFFNCRGCAAAEDLADETINRVIRRVLSSEDLVVPDRARFFYGFAHYLHLEYINKQVNRDGGAPSENLPDQRSWEVEERKELIQECLERCLQELGPQRRELVVLYYQQDKRVKSDHRRAISEQLGCTVNALRIQMTRVRRDLRRCLIACMSS